MALLITNSFCVFEEIFYRGLIFNELKKKLPVIVAILIQALIFAVCHDKARMPHAFIAGILFAVTYLWFKTIWAPIIAHIINYNVFLYSATLIKLKSYFYGLPYILPMLVILIFSIYLIWKNKNVIINQSQKVTS
ncbi:MAG TPA: hypothetical protein DDW65_18925 [Firmicutes bacterium]|jgi:uncharacterized protein|nr:hypothetical protein [Bacillota bacterium]